MRLYSAGTMSDEGVQVQGTLDAQGNEARQKRRAVQVNADDGLSVEQGRGKGTIAAKWSLTRRSVPCFANRRWRGPAGSES